jgi:N-methylhydantoinase A
MTPVELPKFERTGAAVKDAWRGTRRACFDGAQFDCPIYERERLDVGSSISGPAVLEQLDCTTVIRPGQVARVDEWKNLFVTQES